jgi:hypothetical protein
MHKINLGASKRESLRGTEGERERREREKTHKKCEKKGG